MLARVDKRLLEVPDEVTAGFASVEAEAVRLLTGIELRPFTTSPEVT